MKDVLLILFVFVGLVSGWRKGFVSQLFGTFGWLVAVVGALWFYPDVSGRLVGFIQPFFSELPFVTGLEQTLANIASIVLLYFVIKIALGLLGNLCEIVEDLPILSSLNALLGGVFGTIKVGMGIAILFFLSILLFPVETKTWYSGSEIVPQVIPYIPFAEEQMNSWLHEFEAKER
ncbi:MAG: CvpA family protein [Bacilli bacterium]